MAKTGNSIAFTIAAVAVTIFALPTLVSTVTEWRTFLSILIILIAITALFILMINRN